MRKTTEAILGVFSGVALTIGTATAAPPTPPEAGSATANSQAEATKANELPGSEVKVKEGAKPGQQTDTALKSVKIKEGAKSSKATDGFLERSVKVKEGAKPGNQSDTALTSVKVKEGAKAGQQTDTALASATIKEGAKSGK